MILSDAWDSGVLSDLCSLRKETCNPIDCNLEIYVGLEHIESGKFFLKRHGLPKEVKSTKNMFYAGDVIYGKLRPYLDKAVVSTSEGICSTDILVFTPKANVPPSFLAGILHCDKFIQHAVNTTHGVNHPRTSWKSLKDYETKINFPSEISSITTDLGYVRYMAEIWLNDEKIGERLWPPFTFNAETKRVGEIKIRVRVGNLMVNEMGGEDDLGKLRHWGWQAPPDSSFEAGLFGPVEINISKL